MQLTKYVKCCSLNKTCTTCEIWITKKNTWPHDFLEILSIQPPASQTNHGKRSSNLQMTWQLEEQGNPLRLRVEICDDLSNPKEEWKNIELYWIVTSLFSELESDKSSHFTRYPDFFCWIMTKKNHRPFHLLVPEITPNLSVQTGIL